MSIFLFKSTWLSHNFYTTICIILTNIYTHVSSPQLKYTIFSSSQEIFLEWNFLGHMINIWVFQMLRIFPSTWFYGFFFNFSHSSEWVLVSCYLNVHFLNNNNNNNNQQQHWAYCLVLIGEIHLYLASSFFSF